VSVALVRRRAHRCTPPRPDSRGYAPPLQLARVQLEGGAGASGGRLLFMSWSASETLFCVFNNGTVEAFSVLGERSERSFQLFAPAPGGGLSLGGASDEVVAVAACPTGMAALSRSSDAVYRLFLVPDLDGSPSPIVAQSTGLPPSVPPTGLAVLDGAYTASGRMEALLATPDRSIIVVDSDDADEDGGGGARDMQLDAVLPAPVLSMAVSPAGKYVAAVCENGMLAVLDTSFDHKLLEFDTKVDSQPDQVVWCGEDAVCIAWHDKGSWLT
jgi:hypothetical protein